MKRNNLISIGDMSKLSGVHIKSLRYYDRLGILKPAWTDPETSYRFYSLGQLAVVDAIQTCVELDIPLKQFSDFSDDGGNEIHYGQLLEYGKVMAEKKVRAIRARIRKTERHQKEIARAEVLRQEKSAIFTFPQKRYYTMAINENMDEALQESLQDKLFDEIVEKGYEIGNDFGLLYRFSEDKTERFLCAEVLSGKAKGDSIVTLPEGRYLSKYGTTSKIEKAPEEYPELFKQATPITVVETELFTGDIRVDELVLELRCSMSVDG